MSFFAPLPAGTTMATAMAGTGMPEGRAGTDAALFSELLSHTNRESIAEGGRHPEQLKMARAQAGGLSAPTPDLPTTADSEQNQPVEPVAAADPVPRLFLEERALAGEDTIPVDAPPTADDAASEASQMAGVVVPETLPSATGNKAVSEIRGDRVEVLATGRVAGEASPYEAQAQDLELAVSQDEPPQPMARVPSNSPADLATTTAHKSQNGSVPFGNASPTTSTVVNAAPPEGQQIHPLMLQGAPLHNRPGDLDQPTAGLKQTGTTDASPGMKAGEPASAAGPGSARAETDDTATVKVADALQKLVDLSNTGKTTPAGAEASPPVQMPGVDQRQAAPAVLYPMPGYAVLTPDARALAGLPTSLQAQIGSDQSASSSPDSEATVRTEPQTAGSPVPELGASEGQGRAPGNGTAPQGPALQHQAQMLAAAVNLTSATALQQTLPEAPPVQTAVPYSLAGQSNLSQATAETTAIISAQILRKLDNRTTRFDMALTPETLGRVDVSLEIDSDGQVSARLAFDTPAAAADLRGRAEELRRQLAESGLQLARDGLEFSERNPSSDSGGGAFDRQPDRHAFAGAARLATEADLDPAPTPTPGPWANLSQTPDRVDLKV